MGCNCKNESVKGKAMSAATKGTFMGSTLGMIIIGTILSPFIIPFVIYIIGRFLFTGEAYNSTKALNYVASKVNKEKELDTV